MGEKSQKNCFTRISITFDFLGQKSEKKIMSFLGLFTWNHSFAILLINLPYKLHGVAPMTADHSNAIKPKGKVLQFIRIAVIFEPVVQF